MSAFGGLSLTSRGKILQSKAQTGVQLKYTRMAVGDGDLGGTSIDTLTALKHEVKSLSLSKFQTLGGGIAVVGAVLSNQSLSSGFYFREIGIYAQDPDIGEILYCYGNAGNLAEYIPPGGSDIIEKNIDVQMVVGNASNITATIDSSLVWETVNGSQTKANAAEQNAKTYADNKVAAVTAAGIGAETPSGALAKINAAIAGLINGAPVALDTLKELADAMGDDPNFATTILNRLTADEQDVTQHKADYVKHPGFAVATGNVNTYAVTLNPVPVAYVDGMAVTVKINADSTAASTINVNGLGAKPIKKANGNDATNLKAGGIYTLRYNLTMGNFILQGEGASGNALASDLIAGKTASTDVGDITGTMPNNGAVTITPGTVEQTIPAGYHNGNGKVAIGYGIGSKIPVNKFKPNHSELFTATGDANNMITMAHDDINKLLYTGGYNQVITQYNTVTGFATGKKYTCQAVITSLIVDQENGDVYFATSTTKFGGSGSSFIGKLDKNLSIVWQRNYDGCSIFIQGTKLYVATGGGNIYELNKSDGLSTGRNSFNLGSMAVGVAADPAGNIYCADRYGAYKYNASNTLVWATGSLNLSLGMYVYSFDVDSNYNIIIGGGDGSNGYKPITYISNSGNILWTIRTNSATWNVHVDRLRNALLFTETGQVREIDLSSRQMITNYIIDPNQFVYIDPCVTNDATTGNIFIAKQKSDATRLVACVVPQIQILA